MIRLLASVRDIPEALAAARAGADFIDLKEPRAGALGGLPPETIRGIVATLRMAHPGLPISATIGDHAAHDIENIAVRVEMVGDCGVDYVKVGIAGTERAAALALLERLAASRHAVVPVFIADEGIDLSVVEQAGRLPFAGLMADTQDKLAGSLFDCTPAPVLHCFVEIGRRAGKLVGLAGALREHHLPNLAALAPDFAGFRSAICEGGRAAQIAPDKLQRLRRALDAAACAPVT